MKNNCKTSKTRTYSEGNNASNKAGFNNQSKVASMKMQHVP